ncbi:MAG: metallophosphoesterase family protein [Verrucomicrobiia bacterium]|jgi:putative phosphoesterase
MKMLIISDVHGNWPALRAVLEAEPNVNQIFCLGDLVNYGPLPVECVAWAKQISSEAIILQGNHDHALGSNTDPHCSAPYETCAAAMQKITGRMLGPDLKQFLAGLQPIRRFQIGKTNCFACHASAKDPLYHYMPPNAAVTLWESELIVAQHPDFLFCGHTHLPVKTRFRRTLVVNPGSVGQPKDGDPRAAYAIWEDGEVTLRRAAYDVEETIRAYAGLGLEPHIEHSLCEVLRTGGNLPVKHYQSLKTQPTHG